jgi:hypothetical protein
MLGNARCGAKTIQFTITHLPASWQLVAFDQTVNRKAASS